MVTKLQKNSADTTAATENPAYSAIELLKHNRFRSVILQILTESVVETRRHEAMTQYLNAFNQIKNNERWAEMPWDGMVGSSLALILLGFDEHLHYDFFNDMTTIAYQITDRNQFPADEVALNILARWTEEINQFFNAKN